MSHTTGYIAEARQILERLDPAAIDRVVASLVALRSRAAVSSCWAWAAAPAMRHMP
jgi:hypothetical protein